MKIRDMFQKDINRDINGVIKVAQDDERSLEQELSEYIITKELRRHFHTFFGNYAGAIDTPTDKIGVWISGFFGSGKSHFLKMLSYLLSNQVVGGKHAIEYFADKFEDPMMYATAVKCVSVPTESILFNIDIEGPIKKDKTAVLRVFAKVFYNHCGFYGEDLKIAQLERFIDKQGKTQAFRDAFQQVNGAPWLECRPSYAFFEDDVVQAMTGVLGMSEAAARNWFNGEENADMSIKQLVADIQEYVDGKGGQFRLLFMVDEVGQYIGDDSDLMINLQSLVEEIGTRCAGKVWVMVTSQEAIDSVVKISGDDFSKIQGRFNTRLSLSSSSVDEVIRKRVLAKTSDAQQLLEMVYDKEHAVLKNLFSFNNPILDIRGFTSGEEFSGTFPFVPYQFIIIQKVLVEIRKHGNSGKHLSGGERSMLSGFQEAAQRVQDRDEHALVPFHQFYDTVHTFLESPIRRVIDRCQTAADNGEGIEPQDVSVLKLLYLIRYIEDVKANIDNIAILMIDDIHTDKIALRAAIQESLQRLQSQNYVSRNGDVYAFLTDEEQDIAIDIKNTVVDSAQIVHSIAQTLFADIYPAKKFRYGKYDFAYDQYVDETLNGAPTGGMRLRVVTVASDYAGAPEAKLLMDSQVNNEAIVVLSGETPYFEDLEQAMKIRKYVKQRNVSQLPEGIQAIIRGRQQQARLLEERVKGYIEQAIEAAKFYVHGEVLEQKATNAKDMLDAALTNLVESVYGKLYMVNRFVESDADILQILNGTEEATSMTGTGANNEDALNEISQWLELQNQKMLTTSMGDIQRRYGGIPYGWREIDIAALVARLVVEQKIAIKYGGQTVGKDERRLVDYLRKKSEIDKATVTRRIAPSEDLKRKSTEFLREYLHIMDIPGDEDGLVAFVLATFEGKEKHYRDLLEGQYAREHYPEKERVEQARELMGDILSQRRDNVALLTRMVQKQDALLDSAEDLENVETFFGSQKPIFDSARKLQTSLRNQSDYFAADTDITAAIEDITAILALPKPYARIKELPELMQRVKAAYDALLVLKREEVENLIIQCMGDIHTLSESMPASKDLVRHADAHFDDKKQTAKASESLVELDAMITQLQKYRDSVLIRMGDMQAPPPPNPESGQPVPPQPKPPKVVSVSRYNLFPVERLSSGEDIDRYVEKARQKLKDALQDNDGVQIN